MNKCEEEILLATIKHLYALHDSTKNEIKELTIKLTALEQTLSNVTKRIVFSNHVSGSYFNEKR